MDGKYLRVNITTPQKTWVFDEVKSVSAPGIMGGFQVLINHAPMIAQIEIGEIKINLPEKIQLYATSGGFLEVLNDQVSLLLESCEQADKINLNRAETAADKARERLRNKSKDIDIHRAEAALARALNRIKIAGKIQ
jgi:F-type H+-transporting ATPase subunit epsilon